MGRTGQHGKGPTQAKPLILMLPDLDLSSPRVDVDAVLNQVKICLERQQVLCLARLVE